LLRFSWPKILPMAAFRQIFSALNQQAFICAVFPGGDSPRLTPGIEGIAVSWTAPSGEA
jgi:hypothetical protein